jgi:hypothetical protein
MGRAHPVGIVPAAILFGMLYQGGAELSFEMPQISRDMITIIQGLVILFAGALEHMFRPAITAFFATLGRGSLRQVHSCGGVMIMEYFDTLIVILQSTVRVSVPLILAALAGSIPSAQAFSTSGWRARCWPRPLPAGPPRRSPARP